MNSTFRERLGTIPRPGVPIDDATLARHLEALADFHATKARRDQWRRRAGTDGNNHSQRTYEQDPTL